VRRLVRRQAGPPSPQWRQAGRARRRPRVSWLCAAYSFGPTFPPAAERCALAVVASMVWKSPAETLCKASNSCRQMAPRPAVPAIVERGGAVVGRANAPATWMPLSTRRSSTRRAPGWFLGRCDSIAVHCAWLSQNPFAMVQAPMFRSLKHCSRAAHKVPKPDRKPAWPLLPQACANCNGFMTNRGATELGALAAEWASLRIGTLGHRMG
jgi:hypothetical protein